jgi:CLIP-associating protein 1/2
LLDKIHDSKEKIHTPAENCMIILGGICYAADVEQSGLSESASTPSASGSHKGKDKETLSQTFESKLKEAFGGKGARPKLAAMNVLLGIRDQHRNMGLRPYLPLLVDALQDGDGTVREVARSVSRKRGGRVSSN